MCVARTAPQRRRLLRVQRGRSRHIVFFAEEVRRFLNFRHLIGAHCNFLRECAASTIRYEERSRAQSCESHFSLVLPLSFPRVATACSNSRSLLLAASLACRLSVPLSFSSFGTATAFFLPSALSSFSLHRMPRSIAFSLLAQKQASPPNHRLG